YRELRLRPNVRRQVFLLLRNKTAANQDVRVELTAAGQTVASTAIPKAAKDAVTPVVFGKPPPPDKKDGKPPALTPVSGPLAVRLLDAKGEELDKILIGVARPKEYVNVDAISFDPTVQDGARNVLE